MVDLRVRDVDEAIICELRDRARREGTTVPSLVKDILENERARRRGQMIEGLEQLRASIRETHGVLPDSTPGIRAERDGLR